jgi:LacI family transcriptional regulator
MIKRPKCTMRDVALLAGVSTSTVSAVVNGSLYVSPERRARVERAMAALDYQPDAIARSLKTGKSEFIGIIVPDITNPFYPELIRGAEDAAAKAGYSVLLCDSSENCKNEESHINALFSRRVDGILLSCCVNSRAHELLARRRFPLVYMDRVPNANVDCSIATDNVQAGYMAAKHLIDLGHRKIGIVAGFLGLSPHHDRLEGIRKAMQEFHLPILDEYLVADGIEEDDGLAAGRALLNLPNPPTAIMAINNKLLLGMLQAVAEKRLRVPDHLSVLGFDDYRWNQYFHPSLTAVAQPTREMGRNAFQILRHMIESDSGQESQQKHVRLPAELRVRKSTGPAPNAQPTASGKKRR